MNESNTAAIPLNYQTPPPSPPKAPVRGRWVLPLLTIASTTAAAALMYFRGLASLLEAISFVTGAICVWLTVRESAWNFPLGLINVATFAFVFLRTGLLADAGLQVVYIILTLVGWYMWLWGGKQFTALRVSRVGLLEFSIVLASCLSITAILWKVVTFAGGVSPFFDAITTALSLCAQWLLNRKRLENWFFWMAADLIYIPLYAYKHLYLTSILYATFLLMCLMGIWQWQTTWRAQREGATWR
jgi:nicotinamide mononucleotide transporter